jgi:hypothetical protein
MHSRDPSLADALLRAVGDFSEESEEAKDRFKALLDFVSSAELAERWAFGTPEAAAKVSPKDEEAYWQYLMLRRAWGQIFKTQFPAAGQLQWDAGQRMWASRGRRSLPGAPWSASLRVLGAKSIEVRIGDDETVEHELYINNGHIGFTTRVATGETDRGTLEIVALTDVSYAGVNEAGEAMVDSDGLEFGYDFREWEQDLHIRTRGLPVVQPHDDHRLHPIQVSF